MSNKVRVLTFDAIGLGDRTYVLDDGDVAVVVDPQRDPRPYLDYAISIGVRITHVLETHVHNDYVSGGLSLARRLGATYVTPRGEPVGFARERIALGDREFFVTGTLRVRALETPGHTAHHLSYLVDSTTGPAGGPGYVCTGGSLLPGGSGRTDLFGADQASSLAEHQWRSVRRLLQVLDESTVVLPTHGFGSFCSAGPTLSVEGEQVTIGLERARNPAIRETRDDYVRSMTSDPPPIPLYYAYMRDRNLAGAGEVRPWKATPVSSDVVSSVIGDGGYVVDLRERRSFAGRHLVGTVNLELGANLATYLGWLFPFEAPITLVARDDTELESARELLARIGREELAAWAATREIVDQNEGATGRYRVATFADLARDGAAGMPTVLDVRHRSEWRAGHLRGARHIPLPELAGADLDLAPDVGDGPIWVHCAAGFRAAVAASILSAGGRTPVLIDDLFLHAKAAGLEVVDETSAIAQSV